MKAIFKLMMLPVMSVFILAGCTEITEIFFDENPADTSSCAVWVALADTDEFLCVECNSDTTEEASYGYCGSEISVRCNSDGAVLYGIAMGAYIPADIPFEPELTNFMTATAWLDDDDPSGPSENDLTVCHEQSMDIFGKHEYKCTTELRGNGKNGGITFEAEIKYDPDKNDCLID